MTIVASQKYVPNIPLKQLRAEDPHTQTAVDGEQINVHGIKQVTLVYNKLAAPATFIIFDVNCAVMGLDTIMKNGLGLTVDEYRGCLGNDMTAVTNHFYLKATVFDGLYSYVDYRKDFTSWYYD
eukprot:3336098-Amphidinium_carterae.1